MAKVNECGACRKPILEDKESIKCTASCNQTFHVHCTPIQSIENIIKLGARIDKWVCPKCSMDKAEESEGFVNEVVTRSTLEEIVEDLKISSSQKVCGVIQDLVELRKSVEGLSKQVNEFKRSVTHVEDEIGHLQSENSRLQTRNGNLWRTVIRLGDEINDLQQLRYPRDLPVETQVARDLVTEGVPSPKAAVTFCLGYLTVAGIICLVASRVFKRTMDALKNSNRNQD